MCQNIEMSNYKNGRMPKSKYAHLLENGCIKEKSCHKKQHRFVSRFSHGLKYSRDTHGNVLCAGCKILLIPANVSDEVFGKYVTKIHKTGGCHNCCYDCEFSSFCNKCALNWASYSGNYVATCPYSFLEQVKNNSYGGGRHSKFSKEEHDCFKDLFSADIKYNNSLCGMFVDPEFLLKLHRENKCAENFRLYKTVVKNILSSLSQCDSNCEKDDYCDFYITKEKLRDEFYKKDGAVLQKPVISQYPNDSLSLGNITRPEMKGPSSVNLSALLSSIFKKV